MFTQGFILLMMLQTPGDLSPASADASAEGDLTLEDVVADAFIENAKMTEHVDLNEFVEEVSELIGPQPPANKEEYVVALSNVMTKPVEELFSFATYEGRLPVENLGNDIRLGSSEARMATLEIAADINSVSKYYLGEFLSKGVQPKVHQLYANSLYFSYREPDGFMRTLTLVGFGGSTVVFAAVSDAQKVYKSMMGFDAQQKQKDNQIWNDWREPKLEGDPIVMQSSSDGTRQSSRRVTVKGESERDVMNFYTRELALSGWKMLSEPSKSENGLVAMFEKGLTRRCSVVIGQVGDEVGSFDVLTLCQEIPQQSPVSEPQ